MDYPDYQRMKDSPLIPVRYWLSKALGVSKSKETYDDLISLMDDPNPNVVCQAMDALGKRGDKKAVDKIIRTIEKSHHWYVQSYGYRAIRGLGWKQKKSN
jgi:HEAT repeat protein